jgi:GxxExxY protein
MDKNKLIELGNEVFSVLGPGYTECVYHNAFLILLRKHGIKYETERIIPVVFEGHTISSVRADIIVDNSIVIELKATKVSNWASCAEQQVKRYMKLLNIKKGIIMNFGGDHMFYSSSFSFDEPQLPTS